MILDLIIENPKLSAAKIAIELSVGSRSIEKNLKRLKEYGALLRHGSPRNGYWEVTEEYRNGTE